MDQSSFSAPLPRESTKDAFVCQADFASFSERNWAQRQQIGGHERQQLQEFLLHLLLSLHPTHQFRPAKHKASSLRWCFTWDDFQRRFLAQQSVAMLKQCCIIVATLRCVKNRRCESSSVTSPLVSLDPVSRLLCFRHQKTKDPAQAWLILFCTSVLVSWPCEGSAAVPPLSDGPETWTTCCCKLRTPEVSVTTPEKTRRQQIKTLKKALGTSKVKQASKFIFLSLSRKIEQIQKPITLADKCTTNLYHAWRTKYCRYLRWGAQLKVFATLWNFVKQS